MNFTITLPFPDSALFPNRSNGRHWSVRQRCAKEAREWAYMESKEQARRLATSDAALSVKILVYPPDKRNRDVDGLLSALKPSLDGIAQGLGVNDKRFNPVSIRRMQPVADGAVVVQIAEAE